MFTTTAGSILDPLVLTKSWRKAADLVGIGARLHDERLVTWVLLVKDLDRDDHCGGGIESPVDSPLTT